MDPSQARQSAHPTPASSSRSAQRRRTRAAIVGAAQQLIRDGQTPSVDEIAAAADISRRTIYMYFSTLDQLLLDAAVGALSETEIRTVLDPPGLGADAAARVDALTQKLFELAPTTLPLGRQIIRLTVDTPPPAGSADSTRRGYRRVEWIEDAIEPLRARLTSDQFDRLVSALCLVVGWEAMVVLSDVRGLDADHQQDVARWTARAVIDAMLAQIG